MAPGAERHCVPLPAAELPLLDQYQCSVTKVSNSKFGARLHSPLLYVGDWFQDTPLSPSPESVHAHTCLM